MKELIIFSGEFSGGSPLPFASGGVKAGFPSPAQDYMAESLARSKRTIIELGLCNNWRFFATFTFSSNRKDYDLNKNKLLTQIISVAIIYA